MIPNLTAHDRADIPLQEWYLTPYKLHMRVETVDRTRRVDRSEHPSNPRRTRRLRRSDRSAHDQLTNTGPSRQPRDPQPSICAATFAHSWRSYRSVGYT